MFHYITIILRWVNILKMHRW